MKRRDLEKHLREHGCEPYDSSGPHETWVNPANGRQTVVPRHKEIATGAGRSICKQLENPVIKKR